MTMIRRVFGVVGLTVGLVAAGVYGGGVASASAGISGSSDGTSFVAVGDIACDTNATAYRNGLGTSAGCRQKAVGDVVAAVNPDVFAPLGDPIGILVLGENSLTQKYDIIC